MSMHTVNRIVMHASPDSVYRLAADIENWPLLLEHYRYVKILETLEYSPQRQRRIVKMSASRSGLPTSWTSIQELLPERREVRYRWIKGIPTGMDVIWTIEPASGGVLVSIDHDLLAPRPILRNPLSMYVLGHVFVEHIAGRTLEGLKRHAESPGPIAM